MKIKQKLLNLVESKLKSYKIYERMRKCGKDVTSTIWWWIAKHLESRKTLDYVTLKLADYYSEKMTSFDNMQINDVVVINNTIFVYLGRPGFMIGGKDENIKKLTEYINKNESDDQINYFSIYLIEDNKSWKFMFFKHLFNRYNRY